SCRPDDREGKPVRRVPENAKLLFGPYEPPPLQKGDRATCLSRDADVVITSWSDGRISWPRCRALGHRGGSGLLVCAALGPQARALSPGRQAADWDRRRCAAEPDD